MKNWRVVRADQVCDFVSADFVFYRGDGGVEFSQVVGMGMTLCAAFAAGQWSSVNEYKPEESEYSCRP